MMGLLDWLGLRSGVGAEPGAMSRRDFFGRMGGRSHGKSSGPDSTSRDPREQRTFLVAAFPYHDGPVVLSNLRPGVEFRLIPEPGHPTDPHAVRIEWGRDHLGYVPVEMAAEIRSRLARGEQLRCRASRVDPAAELAKVLTVEILLPSATADSE